VRKVERKGKGERRDDVAGKEFEETKHEYLRFMQLFFASIPFPGAINLFEIAMKIFFDTTAE
jgi:hypothetical protein